MSPGDAVVCVTLVPACGCVSPSDPEDPVVGRHYRVALTDMGRCTSCGAEELCIIPYEPLLSPHYGWPQSCFRRLEPASEDIFRLADAPITMEPA